VHLVGLAHVNIQSLYQIYNCLYIIFIGLHLQLRYSYCTVYVNYKQLRGHINTNIFVFDNIIRHFMTTGNA